MSTLESKRVCLQALVLMSICVSLGIRMFYSYSKSADQTGIFNENIFIVAAISVIYVAMKGIFAHKAQHYRITAFDFILERIATPVLVIALFSRYTNITLQQLLLDPLIWVFAILLLDPWHVFGRCLKCIGPIQSGRFLYPPLSDKPHSDFDYLWPFLLVMALYIVLWL